MSLFQPCMYIIFSLVVKANHHTDLYFNVVCSKMLGATMPSESSCGTIRGDFCIEVGR